MGSSGMHPQDHEPAFPGTALPLSSSERLWSRGGGEQECGGCMADIFFAVVQPWHLTRAWRLLSVHQPQFPITQGKLQEPDVSRNRTKQSLFRSTHWNTDLSKQ